MTKLSQTDPWIRVSMNLPEANTGKVWFTSDHHFGHANIIRYARRPYFSAAQMDEDMEYRWNSIVGKDDTVYHLGDFAIGPMSNLARYRDALNGKIVLIRGNHDRSSEVMLNAGFDAVYENVIVEIENKRVWLSHYPNEPDYRNRTPCQRPNAPGQYDIAVCGHVHSNWIKKNDVVNVGVDCHDFFPISLDRAIQFLDGRDRLPNAQMLINALRKRGYTIDDQGGDLVTVSRELSGRIDLVSQYRILGEHQIAEDVIACLHEIGEIGAPE
jgi:calcineurin-like phosphoesterase family protein